MLPSQKNLTVAAAIVLGCCGVVEGGNGHGMGSTCDSPYCAACVPERVNYGYFPPRWRRWPTVQTEPAAAQQPETLPTPAEATTPGIPETPFGGAQPGATMPDTAVPEQPNALPEEPPFGEVPPSPPSDESPIELPFGEEPPPFDDAPPVLPTEPQDSLLSPFAPAQPQAAPRPDELPEPEKPAVPDGDLPATMPDEDPFQDDPQQEIAPPDEPAPKSSAYDELEGIRQQASTRWQSTAEAPGQLPESPALPLHESLALPLSDPDEPLQMEADSDEAGPAMLPEQRENPLRSAGGPRRPREIVPAASFSAAETATSAGGRWRANPLRSN